VTEEDPDEKTIERRSRNADTSFGCLAEALGRAWIVSTVVLIAALPLLYR
jgi:hypothetical protein